MCELSDIKVSEVLVHAAVITILTFFTGVCKQPLQHVQQISLRTKCHQLKMTLFFLLLKTLSS